MATMDEKVELGDLVRDTITGFEGIAACSTQWITGCERIGIEPQRLKEDGEPQKFMVFDVDRVVVLEKQKIKLPRKPVGGPMPTISKQPDPTR